MTFVFRFVQSVDVSLSLESVINYLAMALSLFKFVPEHVAS